MFVFCVSNFKIKIFLQLTMSQARKRRRTAESFKDEVKEIVKEMVAEAIPTIASAVVAQFQSTSTQSAKQHQLGMMRLNSSSRH